MVQAPPALYKKWVPSRLNWELAMARFTTWGMLLACTLQLGCDQLAPPAANPIPPAPNPPGVAVAPAPNPPAPAPAPAPGLPSAGSLTLQAARDIRGAKATKLVEILGSVTDDASAAAAAPLIPPAAQEYAAAVKQFNATLAALSLSGQDAQIKEFFEQQPGRPQPETELLEKIKLVVNSPQGPALQREINGLFDAWLASSTTGERRAIERLIEKEKLRR
jgi:hypothetical protein